MSSPLDQLSAGALDWLGRNLAYFAPYAPHSAGSPPHLRAKAVMELALLCHCAARLPDPSGDRLEEPGPCCAGSGSGRTSPASSTPTPGQPPPTRWPSPRWPPPGPTTR